MPYDGKDENNSKQVKIAFDGDAVLFSEESEVIYKTQGLDASSRKRNALNPMKSGPFANY